MSPSDASVRRLTERVLVEENDSAGYAYLRGLVAMRASEGDGGFRYEDVPNTALILTSDRELYRAVQDECSRSGISYYQMVDLLMHNLLDIQKRHNDNTGR